MSSSQGHLTEHVPFLLSCDLGQERTKVPVGPQVSPGSESNSVHSNTGNGADADESSLEDGGRDEPLLAEDGHGPPDEVDPEAGRGFGGLRGRFPHTCSYPWLLEIFFCLLSTLCFAGKLYSQSSIGVI